MLLNVSFFSYVYTKPITDSVNELHILVEESLAEELPVRENAREMYTTVPLLSFCLRSDQPS